MEEHSRHTSPILWDLCVVRFIGDSVYALSSNSTTQTYAGRGKRCNDCFSFYDVIGVLFAFLWDCFFRETWKTWGGNEEIQLGFTYLGWLFGVVLFLFIYGLKCRFGILFLLNLYLPSFSLAQAFGRVGCFLGGCCYGIPCETFGFSYPLGSLPYSFLGDVRLFPVQLVEAFCLLILFVFCQRCRFAIRAATYLIGMSIFRFILEFLRFDNRGTFYENGFLSPAQGFSIFFLMLGLALYILDRLERVCNQIFEDVGMTQERYE